MNPWELDEVDYPEGSGVDITLPDGGLLHLKKLERDYDPRDVQAAKALLAKGREGHEFLTGVIHINEDRPSLFDGLGMVDEPLATLPQSVTRPGPDVLAEIMASFQ